MKVGGAFSVNDRASLPSFIAHTGMTAIQIQYPMSDVVFDMARIATRWQDLGVDLYVHSQLNLNPCDKGKHGWYLRQMKGCTWFADEIKAKGLVLHPGTMKIESEAEAINNTIEFVEKLMPKWQGTLLLEVDAGSKKGTRIGSPAALSYMMKTLADERVKICLDTAHLYARGYDMWDVFERTVMLDLFEGQIGLIHLNKPNPEVRKGFHLDRHSVSFRSAPRDEDYSMIQDLVSKFPAILERSNNLEAMELDMADIRLAMAGEVLS